jgi:hypothetical protein
MGYVVESLRGVEGKAVVWVCRCLGRWLGGGIGGVMMGMVGEEDRVMGFPEGVPESHGVRWGVGSRGG